MPNIDTIIAIQEVANAFNSMWVPTIISIVLYYQKDGSNQSPLFFQLTVIVVSNVLGAPAIFVLVFIHWKKGSVWYQKISPYIFGSLLFFVFLLMPLLNIIIAVILIIDPNISLLNQQIESYVVFFLVLYSIRVIEFFTWVRKSVFDDARTFLSSR